MNSNTSIKIDRDVRQSIAAGGNINGSIKFNFQAPDAVTDTDIVKWLSEGLHLLAADRSRAYAILARKPETYINILKAPENSGRWLLGHPLFVAWRDGTLQTRRLWCSGMPGLGKSTLTSLIIQNLQSINRPGADPSACIYLYFEREHRGQRQLNSDSSQLHVSLVNNLLAQLVSCTEPVSQLIREKHKKSLAGQGLTIQDSLDLLNKEALSFGVVYIVVDALDKCDSGNGQATDENPRHLVVSTYQRDIARLFSEGEQVIISKKDVTTDLKIFVRSRLQEELQSRDDETADEPFLDTCCDEIIQRSEGQTRLTHILQWLTFAMRPLTLDELSCAISVHHITPSLETDTNVLTADELHRLCGDFVVYDGETVSIAHSTAADFLERTYFPETVKNPEMLIAEKCISYLSNPSLKSTLSQSSQRPLALRLEHHPLFTYAAMNWREHFVIATAEGSDLTAQVTDMLSDDNIVTSIYNTMVTPNKENGVTGLHLAALFNLGDIVDSLVNISKARGGSSGDPKQHKSWLDKKTESGETALHYVIRGSHEDDNQEIVKKLLCHGINPNIKNKDGQTALHQAIILKQAEAALVLAFPEKYNDLLHPLLVDTPDEHGYTPLTSAAEHGMVEVVRALTKAGANIDARTEDGRSVLEIAANNNHRELVGVLLRRKVKTRLGGFSLLHWAAEHGYEEIIWELHMRKEDMNLVTSEGSPMICAVRHGHGMPVWLLFNWGAKLDVSDYDGNTALHTAVEKSAERDASSPRGTEWRRFGGLAAAS
ncbi:hypothetical protein NUW58_g1220 [Xylaria curta]|uniref:Uncharacterized protein n=1 Tax=Xylaria curta TaxID=42375 RepID=A0ACC1PLR9_9PEZI|nr:hypothetical protein NUW58_g1220 [Xylaria curta]